MEGTVKIKKFIFAGDYNDIHMLPSEIKEIRCVNNHPHFPEVKSIIFYDACTGTRWFYSTEEADKIKSRFEGKRGYKA